MDMNLNGKRRRKGKRGRTVIARESGFSIREKGRGFIVQVRREGIRETKYFATLEAAKLHCSGLDTKRTNEGLAGFSISHQERDDARRALDLLDGRASLVAAARAWLRLNPSSDAVTVAQLFEKHLADIRARNRREKTIETRRQFLNRFATDYGTRAASAITTEDVEQWLTARVPEKTFNTMRFCLGAAYGFAVRQRIVDSNPVAAILPKHFDRAEPHFWPVEIVANVLRAAAEFQPRLLPYFAICALAGVRPNEAARLDWANINLDESLIRIPAAVSKTKRARLVPIEKNLVAWLLPYRKSTGSLSPPDVTIRRWRERLAGAAVLGLDEVRRRLNAQRGMKGSAIKAGRLSWDYVVEDARKAVKPSALWPADVLRHSYATYWMAVHAHEGRLAEILGNSPRIIQVHYKGLATQKEGQKYFAIRPPTEDNVIRLAATA